MVLKPAEEAPLTPLRLGELCLEAGVPPGVVNVVPGYGETAGAALAAHPDVDKVAFTGSHLTGQKIVQASAGNLKRVSLELGGKSPDIVFADADLDAAVPGAAMAVFANSGQICSAGTRLFVERKIYDEFVGRVADFAQDAEGRQRRSTRRPQIGPLVSAAAARAGDRLPRASAAQEGAAAAVRRRAADRRRRSRKGYFVPPTVFADVRDDMRIAQEEIFGPVISAIPFTDIDEVARARATTRRSASAAACGRATSARRTGCAKAIRAGSVWVNCYQAMDPGGAVRRLQDERLRPRVRHRSTSRSTSTSRRSGSRPPEGRLPSPSC